MTVSNTLRRTLMASAAITIAAGILPASAATIVALTDATTLVWIDTDKLATTGTAKIANGGKLVGMDVRPADGKLYGVTTDGAIVILDPKTGAWTAKSQISEKIPAGMDIAVDFNPVADRMRLIAADGTSLRINVEDGKATVDGKLRYADTDANKGKMAKAGAAAYTNSVAGTKETALYDIDVANGTLVKQVPPNDGILNTVGALGVKFDGGIAFDIWADGKGMNSAWLIAGGALHSVDLATGAAKSVGAVKGLSGKIVDMAILPSN
jgi:Domain of unknown function (DUF4394)